MIVDLLTNRRRYAPLHPGFGPAFHWLLSAPLERLPTGRQEIDRQRLYALVGRDPGRGRDAAKLESHRRYIDIQVTLAGSEEIGWRSLADCDAPTIDFQPDGDVAFYGDRAQTWLAMPPGAFAIFFPEDAHAPLAGTGELHKVVVKVAVNW
jgi:biofilm protein TabA